MKRPGWDEYFLRLAHVVKERSNCIRRQVGAVIVKEKHIIATGYSGTPAGIANCYEGGCERCTMREKNLLKTDERKDLCICLHAELNGLLQSAYHGASTNGAVIYITISPCIQCAKAIINSGIKSVVYDEDYQDNLGIDLLKKAGINVTYFQQKESVDK